ncbi:MAG: peptidoglycan-binding protein [Oscillospiraceae bacterium]|nr:peptidoglycan-binding protein [Oscillospiraceae bacterium]
MAYTDEDKKGHIYEVQDYLRRISRDNENIPLVIPSGVYDERTEEAIRRFQREYDLPVTGKVDRETWDKLYEVYLQTEEYYAELISILPIINADENLKQGERGFDIYILQAMLNTVFSRYANIPLLDMDGIYGEKTADAVRHLQGIAGEEQTGDVDYRTWNRLAQLYNLHKAN